MRAVLALSDGTLFWGDSVGFEGESVGEVVFNTSMSGYQEILTDPSYCSQMITLTYPHIGNVGVNAHDNESAEIHASGLIIRDYPRLFANWRAHSKPHGQGSLADFLKEKKCVAISNIDTRALTRLLRDTGSQNGAILVGDDINPDAAIAKAQAFGGLKGLDLAQVVSTKQNYTWTEGEWNLINNAFDKPESFSPESFRPESFRHVVALDFGIKRNILRMLAARGCKVTVVPAQTNAQAILDLKPDGVFLSNGPGDPEPCDYAIATIKELLEKKIPMFGICLGHQLLGLATGAKTIKMKTGHHGGNHPVFDKNLDKVIITAQNHGFALDETSLPVNVKAFAHSLFDQTLQGIELTDCPAFSFQGHPEASPGPSDISYLFDRFVALMS